MSKPTYKVALLGDGAVGKTSLRKRYMGEVFNTNYLMTVGADFGLKQTEINEKQINIQIWDLAGQPRFEVVRKGYYRGTLGALVVFDITQPKSFANIITWIIELWKNNGKGKLPIVLIGNKVDLREEYPNSINSDQGRKFTEQLSNENGFQMQYLETSAKTGENVDQAFTFLGNTIMNFIDTSLEKKNIHEMVSFNNNLNSTQRQQSLPID